MGRSRTRPRPVRHRRRRFEQLESRLLLTATPRGSVPYIDMGPSDNLGWNQPMVTVELFADAAGTQSLGPATANSFILDTGANTVTAFASAVAQMSAPPFQYEVEGQFAEIGIGGSSVYDLSAPYRIDFAGTDGTDRTLQDARIISDPDNDVSALGPWGVMGMPAMVDRVTTLDYTVWDSLLGLGLNQGVEFRNDLPADNGHRYSIPVDNRISFSTDGQVVSGDGPPVWADIPFLTAHLMHEGQSVPGDFVFDTGAQLSFMSTQMAIDLGLDSNNDGVLNSSDANFTSEVQLAGLGGTVNVPRFSFNEVHLPTEEGVDLAWTGLDWVVFDIYEGIDGVIGSDILVSGWLQALLIAGQSGWVDQTQLDFREMSTTGEGTVFLDVNAARDVVITPPDPPFAVSELTATSNGFVADFNGILNPDMLNLYDTESAGLGPADVTLVGATTGPVVGSLVVDSELQSVTFLSATGPLAADTYTVTLRSALDGFRSASGVALDGDGDSTEGGDYVTTFQVTSDTSPVVAVADVVRGPGQSVDVPATATGIPLTVSDTAGVRSISFSLHYDPAMLQITGAQLNAAAPAGAEVSVGTEVAGIATVSFTSPVDLPAGAFDFASLVATVPTTNAAALYGASQVLDVQSLTVQNAAGDTLPSAAASGIHLASFFGDVSGNGRINASDAALVARHAALIDTGFVASPLVAPTIVADISGNGRVNASDASKLAQFAALLPVPEIPAVPGGVLAAGGTNAVPAVIPQPTPWPRSRHVQDSGSETNSSETRDLPDHARVSAAESRAADAATSPHGEFNAATQEESLVTLDQALAALGEDELLFDW